MIFLNGFGRKSDRTRREKIVTGNGTRAARREKALSKPLESGKTPHVYGWTFSAAYMRRRAHRNDRRFVRERLKEACFLGDLGSSDDAGARV